MPDLPREPGTLYARWHHHGRYRRVDYTEAYEAWTAGEPVYVKDGNGYVQEVQDRPWTMVVPCQANTNERN